MNRITFYTTIENKILNDDSHELLYEFFDDENQAWNKFYNILAVASISDIPYHAGYLIQDNGMIIGSRVFDRRGMTRQPSVEPDPGEDDV